MAPTTDNLSLLSSPLLGSDVWRPASYSTSQARAVHHVAVKGGLHSLCLFYPPEFQQSFVLARSNVVDEKEEEVPRMSSDQDISLWSSGTPLKIQPELTRQLKWLKGEAWEWKAHRQTHAVLCQASRGCCVNHVEHFSSYKSAPLNTAGVVVHNKMKKTKKQNKKHCGGVMLQWDTHFYFFH